MRVVAGFRVLLALVVLSAVATQAAVTVAPLGGWATPQSRDALANFFSYFTTVFSVLGAVVLLVGAVRLATGRPVEPRLLSLVRATLVTCLVLTGIVYNALLRGVPAQATTVVWANEALHVVAPVCLLADWVLAPGRQRLRYRAVWPVLAVPIAWLGYTLARGPTAADPFAGTTYWYPYPFLDPEAAVDGYRTVLTYVVVLAAVVIGLGLGVIWISRRRSPAPRSSS